MALGSSVVEADDLVLPYTCTMERGVPRLTPSDTMRYHIVGPRSDQAFTTCASSAAWTCQPMNIHKFTIECAGQRVAWAKVAAAARGLGIAIPDRLPAGFAPISSFGGRFIFPGPGNATAIPRVTSEMLSRDAELTPAAAPKVHATPAAWVTVVDPADTPSTASGGALKVAGFISTLVASLMGACLLFVRRRQVPAFEFSADPTSADSAPGRPWDFASASFAAFWRRVQSWRSVPEEIMGGADFSETLGPVRAKLQQAEIDVSMLPSDLLLRDVLTSELDALHQRVAELEVRSRNLEPERLRSAVRATLRDLDRIGRIARGARLGSEEEPASPIEAEIPSTPFEAYRILGLNPDAPDAAVKKIVDALRMSWHPDHARDEADRQFREQRIKQVNAAWDLLKSRTAAAA